MSPRRRIVPIFVPHMGCPHDCVFCNQRKISGHVSKTTEKTVTDALSALPQCAGAELAFYGGSFTAIDPAEQEKLLGAAQPSIENGTVDAIRVSTRPDCIDAVSLDRLEKYGVKTIELGVQSMCDDVLEASGRGYMSDVVAPAAARIKERGFQLVLQMMTGLPGDTAEKSLYTARSLCAMKPDGVRIYPAVIIRDTAMLDMYNAGLYREHTVEDAVSLCAEIVPVFEETGIPIIRLGLNPTDDLSGGEAVGGAYHPAFGELVYGRIYLRKERELLRCLHGEKNVVFEVARGKTSMATGQRAVNTKTLKAEFGLESIKFTESDISAGEIRLIKAF